MDELNKYLEDEDKDIVDLVSTIQTIDGQFKLGNFTEDMRKELLQDVLHVAKSREEMRSLDYKIKLEKVLTAVKSAVGILI